MSVPRSATFMTPSSLRAGNAQPSYNPSGTYNSHRNVPPPTTVTAPSVPEQGLASSSFDPGPSSSRAPVGSAKSNPLFTRAVIMVDDATEPGIGDVEGEHRRIELVNLVLTGGDVQRAAPAGNSPGAAVAFAIRKRLKSDDHVAVLNTLTLLDEVMRTCPYFYRYIANDKFFRRLWRFVDPEYKTDLRGRIPFLGKSASKQAASSRSVAVNVELAERVMILVRAWAEDLSIMLTGSHDTYAGFFIERYMNKRTRIKFPEVPATGKPWVCSVSTTSNRSRFRGSAGSSSSRRRGTTTKTTSPLPQSLTLDEVENTVNLFSNMLEKASDIEEVRGDVCGELAERCRLISQHMDTMSGRMERDEELSTVIRVSEQLQQALTTYDKAVDEGIFENAPPIVNGLTDDESEDEGYDDAPRRAVTLPVHPTGQRGRYFEEDRDELRDELALNNGINRSREYESRRGRGNDRLNAQDVDNSRYLAERDEPLDKSRDKPRTRRDRDLEKLRPDRKEAKKSDAYSSKASSKSERSDKASGKGPKSSKKDDNDPSQSMSGKAGKTRPTGNPAAHSRKSPDALVDVAEQDEASTTSSNDSDESEKKGDAFGLLADRYASSAPKRSSKQSSASVDAGPSGVRAAESHNGVLRAVGGVQNLSISPMSQPQYTLLSNQVSPASILHPSQASNSAPSAPDAGLHPPQLPYGSVVMMPSPMGMNLYGSYNPSAPPMAPFHSPHSAYNTVNPALYYSTVNPLLYGSVTSAGPLPVGVQQSPTTNSASASSAFPANGATLTGSVAGPSGGTSSAMLSSSATSGGPVSAPPPPPPTSATPATASSVPMQASSIPPTQSSLDANALSPGSSQANMPLDARQQHPSHVLVPSNSAPQGSHYVQQVQSSHIVPNHAVPPAVVAYNPGLYGSVSNQPPMGSQSLYTSSAGTTQSTDHIVSQLQPSLSYPSPYNQSMYASVSGAPLYTSVQGTSDQASIYQSAMANAAAAYHAAASAYQSVQNQPPIAQTEQTGPQGGSIPTPPVATESPSSQDQRNGQ